VIFYANRITDSMKKTMDETSRRREKQIAFNTANGITPKGVNKRIKDIIEGVYNPDEARRELKAAQASANYEAMSEKQRIREMKRLEKEMHDAAKNLDFEKAAQARDQLKKFREQMLLLGGKDTELSA
jgi:excinuclease ABC subunit B